MTRATIRPPSRADAAQLDKATFTYFFLHPEMMIRVLFKVDDEAEAFAKKFEGSLLDTRWAADQLITV